MKNNQHIKNRTTNHLLFVFILLFVAISCKDIGEDITAKSPIITKEFSINDYTSINFGVPFSIYYTTNDTANLYIEAQPEMLDYIAVNSSNNELSIQLTKKINTANFKPIRIYTSSSSINKITNSQIGVVNINDSIFSSQIDLLITNNGKILVKKINCKRLDCTTFGASELIVNAGISDSVFINHNSTSKTNLVTVASKYNQTTLNGNGIVTISVQDTLSATIVGDGSIQYSGNPAIYQKITGKGKVLKL